MNTSTTPARKIRHRLSAPAVAGLVTLALALTGCGGSDTPEAGTEASAIAVGDPWVKAADSGMTAAFGVLSNSSDSDVTVVSATSDASPMELHEMAMGDSGEMVMRPKRGGFVIPAGKSHELDPGGDHLMLMDVEEPVKAGDDVDFTLKFDDGSTMKFTAPARTFSGANEDYEGDAAADE